jgi:hypothetical protein
MSFDGDEFGMDEDCGYDDSYDPADDIYAGTAQCDDGSDRDFDDRIEGEDIEGEMGAGEVEPVATADTWNDSQARSTTPTLLLASRGSCQSRDDHGCNLQRHRRV